MQSVGELADHCPSWRQQQIWCMGGLAGHCVKSEAGAVNQSLVSVMWLLLVLVVNPKDWCLLQTLKSLGWPLIFLCKDRNTNGIDDCEQSNM